MPDKETQYPFHPIRVIIAVAVFLFTFLISVFKVGMEFWFICLIYSLLNLGLVLFFFRFLMLPLQKSFFQISILYFLLNIPLLLYLPLSTFFWLLFVFIYAVHIILCLVFSKSTLLPRIFLASVWVLLSASGYSWFISILKVDFDLKLARSLNRNARIQIIRNTHIIEKFIWKKPVLWSTERFSFWQKFLFGKNIIFQFQPSHPLVLIHYPHKRMVGWLSYSDLSAFEFFSFLSSYLDNQRHLIWSKFIDRSKPIKLEVRNKSKDISFYFQTYLFFDFDTKKKITLNFIIVSLNKNGQGNTRSLIFCLKQPLEESFEYYLEKLIQGVDVMSQP